ncbi:MAG: hypothetical protein JXA21_05070 [Anaerolineae bacterium]|nr:hypothetical protein [Anaerolineae bacterium]
MDSRHRALPISLIALVIILGSSPFASQAQTPIPGYNDWSQAGYTGEIPTITTNILNVKDFGAAGNGSTDDAAAIQAAINDAPNPAVIFFPAGTYRIQAQLTLKSGIVLRGEGYRQTHLECLNTGGCIRLYGALAGNFVNVQSGLAKGSRQIVVADAASFVVGQGGEIQQDNIVPSDASWGQVAVGQMVKIVAINGNTLTIEPPLHLDYGLSYHPQIRPVRYIEQVGIEDLHLKRLDSGSEGENNIAITRAADCWIRRVESEGSEKYHVGVSESLYLEIRDSYFHHAYYRGDGGQGYGVSLARHVTSVLVENNIFNELRHAMIVQLGTNGCVFGYNYPQRNFSDDGWDKTSIALHGHYPFLNLFESNIAGWAGMDNVWGPNGPDNTLFRNRIVGTDKHEEFGQYRGVWMQGFRGSQYIAGNEINTIGAGMVGQDGIYIPTDANGNPADVIVHGNNIRGAVTWNPAWSQTLPASYYLPSKPAFYGAMTWPSLGGDQPFGQGKIPALVRWETGEYIPTIAGPALTLHGTPGDRTVRLTWTVEGTLPPASTWQIAYEPSTGTSYPIITGILSPTRDYLLNGLTNYVWYTVTLDAVLDNTSILSDTVLVMPTDRFVYLPLITKK